MRRNVFRTWRNGQTTHRDDSIENGRSVTGGTWHERGGQSRGVRTNRRRIKCEKMAEIKKKTSQWEGHATRAWVTARKNSSSRCNKGSRLTEGRKRGRGRIPDTTGRKTAHGGGNWTREGRKRFNGQRKDSKGGIRLEESAWGTELTVFWNGGATRQGKGHVTAGLKNAKGTHVQGGQEGTRGQRKRKKPGQ